MSTFQNLPLNLASEQKKFNDYYSLQDLGRYLTTTGQVTFNSTSSGTNYNTATYGGGAYNNQGEYGMFQILQTVLSPYLVIADTINTINAQLADNAIYNTSLIPETLKKLQSGVDTRIDIVGDSITQGVGGTDTTCYVGIFTALIATLFPNSTVIRYDGDGIGAVADAPITSFPATTIQTGTNGQTIRIVRNGVGGDTTLMLGRRIDNFTLSSPIGKKPDLVIICVGVNDSLTAEAIRYTPASRYKWQLDGLVRNIKQRTGSEIALMTPPCTSTISIGDYATAMQQVAKMNGLQCIEAYALWLSHYVAGAAHSGQGDWGIDTWHPTPLGHTKIGTLLYETLFKYNQRIVPLTSKTLRYWYDDIMFTYSDGWSLHTIDNLSDGKNVFIEKAGLNTKTVTFSVYANEIAVLTRPNQDGGKFTYAIDGGTPVEIDLLTAYPTSRADVTDLNSASMSAEKVVIASGLDNSLHTVVLTCTQNYIYFSGIEIVLSEIGRTTPTPKTMNSGSLNITGTGTTYKLGVATFSTVHSTIPIVIPTTNDVNYVAAIGTIRVESADIYISRKDGATFTSTVGVSYISIDS